jgi:putative transposase
MKRLWFSDTQILSILIQAENDIPVPKLCREHNISSATFYNWQSKYGGM